jgi:rare lipoprotein A
MRTTILSALAVAMFGVMAIGPASAENAPWQCMSPAFACGGAPTVKSHRSYGYDGERGQRRHATSKHKTARVAKLETVKPRPHASKKQAKVELPERKQQHASVTGDAAKAPTLEKKPEIAVRKVETEPTVRVTSAQSGMASYYWQGQMTASGARFNPNAMTAAHRSLPFGTKVRVTNKRNGKSVVVTINDRGPFIRGRIIDLSNAAAGVIGMRSAGVAPVVVERIAKN